MQKIKHICKVLKNEEIIENVFKMKILSPYIAKNAKAGQFVHIKVAEGHHPLLRRPFCIHDIEEETFSILYKIKGLGTKILSCKKEGDFLDVLGPLGNGFSIKEEFKNVLFLCGGIGIAPFPLLAKKLVDASITLLYGVKKKNEIIPLKDLEKMGIEILLSTEDGSAGYKGTALELFLKIKRDFDQIYICGPKEMLFSLASIKKETHSQALFEERMGCGVGGCGCCVIRTVDGIKKVCEDGPVFPLWKIKRW